MYKFLTLSVIACGVLVALNIESSIAASLGTFDAKAEWRNNDLIRKEDPEEIGGFVLFRDDRGKTEFLLLEKASEKGDWSPPKGHVEKGEIPVDAAYREMREETTLLPQHYEVIFGIHHYFEYETSDDIPKHVTLWPARLTETSHPIVISDESRDYKWADTSETLSIVKKQYKQAFVEIIQKLDCYYHAC